MIKSRLPLAITDEKNIDQTFTVIASGNECERIGVATMQFPYCTYFANSNSSSLFLSFEASSKNNRVSSNDFTKSLLRSAIPPQN